MSSATRQPSAALLYSMTSSGLHQRIPTQCTLAQLVHQETALFLFYYGFIPRKMGFTDKEAYQILCLSIAGLILCGPCIGALAIRDKIRQKRAERNRRATSDTSRLLAPKRVVKPQLERHVGENSALEAGSYRDPGHQGTVTATSTQYRAGLFDKLPAELRHMIYCYVLTAEEPLHLKHWRASGRLYCDRFPRWTFVGLLLTCRGIYQESVHLLYEQNTLSFAQPAVVHRLPATILPTRLQQIGHIRVTVPGVSDIMLEQWSHACEILAEMRGLRSLAVEIEIPATQFIIILSTWLEAMDGIRFRDGSTPEIHVVVFAAPGTALWGFHVEDGDGIGDGTSDNGIEETKLGSFAGVADYHGLVFRVVRAVVSDEGRKLCPIS
ncbi:uncharacterized protein BDV17DRAFT_254359 [Aspergillus undulatus]|uniref:uncharacterized protein n=1 Tax=Aspergillus undulatus TaxID=1810928 RepID=UPI003CCD9164